MQICPNNFLGERYTYENYFCKPKNSLEKKKTEEKDWMRARELAASVRTDHESIKLGT